MRLAGEVSRYQNVLYQVRYRLVPSSLREGVEPLQGTVSVAG